MKKKIFASLIALLLLVIVFIGCLGDSDNKSQGRTIYVDISGGKDFKSIQDAINNASNGDTIVVSEGVYYEFLHINKSVNLKGFKYTIISPTNVALNKNSIMYINADNCSIIGFTLLYGNFETNIIGININSSNNIIKSNSILKLNHGIYLKNSVNGNVLTKNNISNNAISNCSYGIMVYGNAKDNIIFNNDLIDNSNGIYLEYFFNNSVLENYVYSNTAYGIYLGSRCDGNIVSRNICNNNRYGIRFKGVSFNEIYLNRLENNEIGLYSCCGSTDNILYKNTLINNAKHASDGFTNSWDNGIVGNYWEDYIVIYPNATKIDNVWNTPYNITDGNNKDNFPLINPPI